MVEENKEIEKEKNVETLENKKLSKKEKIKHFKETGEFVMKWYVRANKSSELYIPQYLADLLFQNGWESGIKYKAIISSKWVTLFKEIAQSNEFVIFRSCKKKRGKYENTETTLYLPLNMTKEIQNRGIAPKSEFTGVNEDKCIRIWF